MVEIRPDFREGQPTTALGRQDWPKFLVLYPSYTLWGSHEHDHTRDGHYVIENGWDEYANGYHHKRDGVVWQVRDNYQRGSYCPHGAIDSEAIGICIVGIPGLAPPYGALPANNKYDLLAGKAVWTTERQMISLIELCAYLCRRHDINPMKKAVELPSPMESDTHAPAIYQRRRLRDGLLRSSECAFTNVLREEIAHRNISRKR